MCGIIRLSGICHHAVEVFVCHGYRAADQIAEDIGEIRVEALDYQIPADHAVIIKGHLMQHEISHGIHADHICQIIRVDHIALGLAHLAVALQQPRMSEYLLGQWQIQRHQEYRPVDGMETYDILAYQMQVCRPVFLHQTATFVGISRLRCLARRICRTCVALIAVQIQPQTRDIVRQCVQPYIDHMAVVEINRNTPFEAGSGYAQILQTRQQEIVHHLISARRRLDELGMLVDMLYQAICIFAHSEKICFFPGGLDLTSAIRAFPVYEL